MRVLWLVGITLALFGCASRTLSSVASERLPAGVTAHVLRVEAGELAGLSGMTTDEHGRVWSVAERERALVRLVPTREGWRVEPPAVRLMGIDEGIETESLAWLGDGRFVLGTETQDARSRDLVLVMRVSGARAVVERRMVLDYEALGLRAEDNAGIEAACVVGEHLVLGVEHRSAEGVAPLAIVSLRDGSVRPWRLRLTSPTGKLASLDCGDAGAGTIDLLAIERHYGVARVLHASIQTDANNNPVVVPETLINLDQVVAPLPNYESIARLGDDVLLVTDNHHGKVTGPTQALRLHGLKLRRWLRSGS